MTSNEQPGQDAKPPIEPEFLPIIEILNGASGLAEKGELDVALERIGAAEAALMTVAEPLRESPRGIALAAALCEGRGQVGLRKQDFATAYTFLGQAETLRQREEALGGRPNPLARAVSNLNLSSAAQRMGHLPEALEHNTRCQLLLTQTREPSAALFMAASLEARGTIFAQLQRFEDALEAFIAAQAAATPLLEAGLAAARPLLAEVYINTARVQHQLKQSVEALETAGKAADVAWQQLEANQFKDQQAGSLYISAEMNQVAYAEAVGSFARAEDAIFRVLKLIGPDPRVVEHGVGFYTRLLAKTDAELDVGDLPRDEVEESLGRLQAMVKPQATA